MKIGTPSWWSPPQPPAGSKVPRPATTAPVDMNSSQTVPLTPDGRAGTLDSPLGSSLVQIHSCRRSPPSPSPLSGPSFGPAMSPSREIGHIENGCGHGVSLSGFVYSCALRPGVGGELIGAPPEHGGPARALSS